MSQADSTTSSDALAYAEGEDVLLRGPDGLMYLGVVVEVEGASASCLVRFGDCTEKWAHFGDLRRLGDAPSPDPQPGDAPLPPPPPAPLFKEAPRPYSSTGCALPDHILLARKELPYDFDSLLWDESHQRNDKERYCYCGESGDWYKKMLQCNRCLQWFHQDCIRVAHSSPLLFGDRFFDFVCTLCTGTCEEILHRIDLCLVDALHLVLFNLTVINSKKYHSLESSVIPFLRLKWKSLQGPSNLLKSSRLDLQYLNSILESNKSRFKSGSEIKKRSTFWGLRNVAPPLPEPRGNINFQSTNGFSSGSSLSSQDNMFNRRHKRKRPLVPLSNMGQGAVRKTAPVFLNKKDLFNLSSKAKRGRPTKYKARDSLDSCGSSDASSSTRGTLELFIPPPTDFEGYNNPFRDVDNCLRLLPEKCSKTDDDSVKSFDVIKPAAILPMAAPPYSKKGTGLFDDLKTSSSFSSIFGTGTRRRPTLGKDKIVTCARRLTLDGEIQYLIEWDTPPGPIPTPLD